MNFAFRKAYIFAMIIQSGNIISNNDKNINSFQYCKYTIYFKGLIFVSGFKCGDDSIKYILDNFSNFDYEKIFGNYFLYIIDNDNNKQYFFVDNSGLFKTYIYKNCISTSFLELIEFFDEINIDKLDFDSIIEFFHFGFVFFDNTLIKDIKKIGENDIYIFENYNLMRKPKGLSPISYPPTITINKFFEDLIYAIKGKCLSIDLTGGFDTRLIVSFFNRANIVFELALSGRKQIKDVKIASIIASKINKIFYQTLHSVDNITNNELNNIFEYSDSQIDIVEYHRIHQFNHSKILRHVEVHLNGGGGAMFKDFFWLQDFPFYNKRKTNLDKLYKYRIEGTSFPHTIFSNKLKQKSILLKTKTINRLKSLILETNSKSYDNIYFKYKMQTNVGVFNTITNNYFISYSPLLERELVKIGFNLKRAHRFFNIFHKKLITQNCPEICKIRTNDGTTTSSFTIDCLTDISFFILNRFKRLFKLIFRKLFKKSIFQESPTDIKIYEIIRKKNFFIKNVDLLKKYDILNENIICNNISNRLIGKILTIGFLLKKLEK